MNIVILQPLTIADSKLDAFVDRLHILHHDVQTYDQPPKTTEETVERAKNADIIITVNYPLDKTTLSRLPKLKMISIAFTGYDHVDIDYCKQNSITVTNAAGYATDAVAELTFGLILNVLRSIREGDAATRSGGTRAGLIGHELRGKTLGIMGTGAIGLRVAQIGKAFGCEVLGFSRSKRKDAASLDLQYVDLPTLLQQSDIISVHTPLTPQTKDLLSWKEFQMMKPSAILIQTSRGGTVNEDALVDALTTGKIAGVGVDVFVQEPPIDRSNPILKTKKSILTPHVAFATTESLERRASIAFQNIEDWLKGAPISTITPTPTP